MDQKQNKLEKKLLFLIRQFPEYEQKLKEGKNILRLLDKYGKTLEETEKRLSNGEAGLSAQLQQATNLKENIDSIHSSVQQVMSEFKQMIENAESEINKSREVISKIDDPESGLEFKLNTAIDATNRTITAASSTETLLASTKNNVEEIKSKVEELNNLYKEFLEIKIKIDDPENGLVKILENCGATRDEITAIKDQSKTLFTEISRIKDDSNNFLNDIKNIKSEAEIKNNNVKNFAKESEEYKSKIAQIYELATGSGLANSFDKRKKELYLGMYLWLLLLIGTIIVYLYLISWVISEVFRNSNPSIDAAAWYRLTLTLPLIFLVGFASMQYSKERNLLEKYAFKSATALALEAYTRLLTEKFSDAKDKIITFVLNAMTMIYKEPHDKEKTYKMNFGFNKVFNIGLEEQTMQEVEEIVKQETKRESSQVISEKR